MLLFLAMLLAGLILENKKTIIDSEESKILHLCNAYIINAYNRLQGKTRAQLKCGKGCFPAV